MPLNFPNNPTNGQVYTDSSSGISYFYDSSYSVWRANGSPVLGGSIPFQVLYNDAASVNGSNALTFTKSSNTLYAQGNIAFDSPFSTRITTNGAANSLSFYTTQTQRVTIDPTGNLLINRTTSDVGNAIKLDINGGLNTSAIYVNGILFQGGGTLYQDATATQRYLVFSNTNTGVFSQANVDNDLLYTPSNNRLDMLNGTVNTANVLITTNLLIGRTDTTLAGIKLDINAGANSAGWYDRGTLVQVIANSYAQAVGVGANTGTGVGANAYAQTVGAASNGWTNTIFTSANAKFNANVVVFDDTVSVSKYVLFTDQTSGSLARANISAATSPFSFNPSTGNVMINRTTSTVGQAVKLDVFGGINASAVLVNGTAVASSITVFDDSVNATKYFLFTDQTSGTLARANISSATGTLAFNPSSGNVMINRTDSTVGSAVKLDVAGAINASSVLVNGTPISPTGDFNTNIVNAVGTALTTSLVNVFTAPSTANKRYIVRSVQISSINATNEVTANGEFHGTNYSNSSFALSIPVPVGSAVELLKKPKIMYPSDILRLQANTASSLYSYVSYEILDGTAYFGNAVACTAGATFYDLHTASSASVVESVLLCNVDGIYDVRARVAWTDGSNVLQSYLCYDMIIPADSTVELLDMPKALPNGHKIRVYAAVGNRLEAIIAGKSS